MENFSNEQIVVFSIGILLLVNSYYFFFKGQKSLGLLLLVLGTLGLGFFMAMLDPFLFHWDEQYHALVAKNMAINPLKPILIEHSLRGLNYKIWTDNHVWLHKQPLFLWQMALSIKLFGTNEIAVRLPSIIMHAIVPLFIYRIGKIAVNANVGYYGALFFAVASFPLELIAGFYPTDHNDVAFLFYVSASCWAWFEYQKSKQLHWVVLIGVFSGAAILVKWLAGLLVFAIWPAAETLAHLPKFSPWQTLRPMLLALAICCIVAIPWQVYIHTQFPEEATHEYAMMHEHFSKPIEGHGGDSWFHFDEGLKKIYGSGQAVAWLLLLGIVTLLFRANALLYAAAIGVAVVGVYGFYTLAATKMIGFPLIVAPFLFLGLGALTDGVFGFLRSYTNRIAHRVVQFAVCFAICFLVMDMHLIHQHRALVYKGQPEVYRIKKIAERKLVQVVDSALQSKPHVLFNAGLMSGGDITFLFFSNHIAFGGLPTPEDVVKAKMKYPDFPIAIIDQGQPLPDYLTTDSEIQIICAKQRP